MKKNPFSKKKQSYPVPIKSGKKVTSESPDEGLMKSIKKMKGEC